MVCIKHKDRGYITISCGYSGNVLDKNVLIFDVIWVAKSLCKHWNQSYNAEAEPYSIIDLATLERCNEI